MIGYSVKVTYNAGDKAGESVTAKVTAFVMIGIERKFSKSVVRLIGEDMMMEPLLWMGWEAVKQAGNTVPPFEDWVKQCDPNVELVAPAPLGEQPS